MFMRRICEIILVYLKCEIINVRYMFCILCNLQINITITAIYIKGDADLLNKGKKTNHDIC